MRVPQIVNAAVATAASSGGTYVFDMRGVDRASLQLNATLASTNTDVITLKISNDGVNYVGFSTAKTVTFTGGGTINALFELGPIDYAFLQVSYATPSAGTVSLVGFLYVTATITQGA